MTKTAVIGGTGLNHLAGLEQRAEHALGTPWGAPSHPVISGRYAGSDCLFLARHGSPAHLPPHRINYRANLWALRELGASSILAVNAVGGIQQSMGPGHVVIPDQLIDYSWGRGHSYHDDDTVAVQHIDFTLPYDSGLRRQLIAVAEALQLSFSGTGTHAVTQGPRLETAAEIRRLRQDGADVVGMTGMPEASLAAELGIPYASICLVVNPAAGMSEVEITLESMGAVMEQGALLIGELLSGFLQAQD
ncbi:MAG: S-methyl-5'-thioinosine phosphorylase [Halieaceae bacterium]